MSIPNMTNDLAVIQKLSDLPNSTEGLTADQLKAKFDEAALEIQSYINERLIPAIVAAQIPFTPTTEINAEDVDAAIREVQSQVRDASTGAIVNGSVTTEKLSATLLARVYGGRPWVSLNTPGSEQNTATDFPIGQIWLRPSFTVVNVATENWVANGCTVEAGENRFTVTGNNTVVTATATQALTNIGQDGDRVMVLFGIANKDSDITNLTVSLNSGEEKDAAVGVFSENLVGGALTVQISATWPSTSLADGSFDVVNYAVVNLDQALRQATDAEDMTDWAGFLNGLLPLDNYTSPEEVFIQTLNGNWWPLSYSVQPVSRGGTGNNSVGYGEMLYGSGGGALAKLPAGTGGSFLRLQNNVPCWQTLEDTAQNSGFLRMRTGSYTGNGAARTIDLGITPIALLVSPVNGEESGVLLQGSGIYREINGKTTSGSSTFYNAGINLNGSSLTTRLDKRVGINYVDAAAKVLNASGVTYKWAAIY